MISDSDKRILRIVGEALGWSVAEADMWAADYAYWGPQLNYKIGTYLAHFVPEHQWASLDDLRIPIDGWPPPDQRTRMLTDRESADLVAISTDGRFLLDEYYCHYRGYLTWKGDKKKSGVGRYIRWLSEFEAVPDHLDLTLLEGYDDGFAIGK